MSPKRKYDNKYPSVTTALGVLRKIGLEMWFKYNTIEFTNAESEKGKKVGTEIHDAIQQYTETGKTDFETEYPNEVGTALKSFILFRQEHPEIELIQCEQALTSEKYQYNGTIDVITPVAIGDWKSGKCGKEEKPKIYPEAKAQVASYVYLWNETQNTNIDKAWIAYIAKDKVAYNYYEMDKQEIDDCFNEVFLSCLKIYNYQRIKR